jgi:hypothetical protein
MIRIPSAQRISNPKDNIVNMSQQTENQDFVMEEPSPASVASPSESANPVDTSAASPPTATEDLDEYGDPIDYSKFPYSWKRSSQPYKGLFYMGYGVFKVCFLVGKVVVGILGLEEPMFADALAARERMLQEEAERAKNVATAV